MKKRKSYFARTFRVNEVMLFILLLLVLMKVPVSLAENLVISQTCASLSDYARIMSGVFERMSNALDWLIVILQGIILLMIIPELLYRMVEDSIINWIYSIWSTYRIRKFLFNKTDYMEGSSRKGNGIQKSIIDIRKNSITYLAKLPNDLQSHKNFLEVKDIIYKEITNQFPNYSFSKFERYKHWIRIDGTKI